jgi:hypothetical protein
MSFLLAMANLLCAHHGSSEKFFDLTDIKLRSRRLAIVRASTSSSATPKEIPMKSFLSTLFSPTETVVAVHDSVDAADDAVKLLGRAGYPGRMIGVVARQCPLRTPIQDDERAGLPRCISSGSFWGAVWVVIALASALLIARNALPFVAILMTGALLLAIQTAMVWSSVAPERSTAVSWRLETHLDDPYRHELAADKLLLVVRGSRSEIALARTLLAMHGPVTEAALHA